MKRNGAMYAGVIAKDIDAVEKALFEIALTDKEVWPIVQELSAPIVESMQQHAPVKDGKVQRSIQIYRSAKSPYTRVQIGPRYIKGGGPNAGNSAHLTEFGTDERVMKTGLKPGGLTSTFEKYKGPPMFVPYKGKKLGRVQAKEWIYQTYVQVKNPTQQKAATLLNATVGGKANQKGFTVTNG